MSPRVRYTWRPRENCWMLYWIEPLQNKRKTRLVHGTENFVLKEVAALQAALDRGRDGSPITWEIAREQFESIKYPGVAEGTAQQYRTTFAHWERLVGSSRDIALVDSLAVSQFESALRRQKLKTATVSKVLRHLRSFLRWCARKKFVDRAPEIDMPKQQKKRLAKGKPITEAQFNSLIDDYKKSGKKDVDSWANFLRGLWLSGFRSHELARLHWTDGDIILDLDHDPFPAVLFRGDPQKSRQEEAWPLPPDFLAYVRQIERRRGLVFPLPVRDRTSVSRQACEILKPLGASCHDLRRSFATRWATKVPPAVLMTMLRHQSISTTMDFYVDLGATGAAWRAMNGQ